jgi:hypothetical protein
LIITGADGVRGCAAECFMPRTDPHPVLDSRAAEALRLLSDPELDDTSVLPSVDSAQAGTLVRAAAVHGTMSTSYRHLRERGGSSALAAAFEAAETKILSAIAGSVRLRRWSERIVQAFNAEGIAHALIKGPVFAARLYRHPSDRIFTDIDIVVPPDSLPCAAASLKGLGFTPVDFPGRDAAGHCEFKWTLQSDPAITAELHTNLIHSAQLRRRISVDFETISKAGNGDPGEATGLLFVAGVHAASGHQFDRLALLVDIAQAVRGISGGIDVERLRSVCRASGTLRAVAAALSLTGRMYPQTECALLANSLMPGSAPLEWRLVSPDTVFKAQSVSGRTVAWRRKVLRQLVARPPRLVRD